jgi:hypothetical protein
VGHPEKRKYTKFNELLLEVLSSVFNKQLGTGSIAKAWKNCTINAFATRKVIPTAPKLLKAYP